ncbi:hypothetical protein AAY473_030886 [Plecturocebus cupreus]
MARSSKQHGSGSDQTNRSCTSTRWQSIWHTSSTYQPGNFCQGPESALMGETKGLEWIDLWLRMKFHHVGQAGFELLGSTDPPASNSQSAGITSMSHPG